MSVLKPSFVARHFPSDMSRRYLRIRINGITHDCVDNHLRDIFFMLFFDTCATSTASCTVVRDKSRQLQQFLRSVHKDRKSYIPTSRMYVLLGSLFIFIAERQYNNHPDASVCIVCKCNIRGKMNASRFLAKYMFNARTDALIVFDGPDIMR